MLATAHRSLARCVWNFSCFTCRTREREKEEKSAMRCWINTPLKLQHALYLLVKRDPSIMPSTLSLSLVRAPEYTRSNCRCDLFSAMRFLERRKCYYIFSSFFFFHVCTLLIGRSVWYERAQEMHGERAPFVRMRPHGEARTDRVEDLLHARQAHPRR